METILLTGFEPFGGWKRNVSSEATAALDGEERSGLRVRALELPVSYSRALETLGATLARLRPLAVVAFGIHGDPTGPLRVEEVAANRLDFSIPDNDGVVRRGEAIEPGAPDELLATISPDELERAIEARSVAVERSRDCGRYLCNAVYYFLLRNTERAAFVHVPPRLPGERFDDVLAAADAAATVAARVAVMA